MDDRQCEVEGCSRPLVARGLCGMHYNRLMHVGHTGPVEPLRRLGVYECVVPNCARRPKYRGRKLCHVHYRLWRSHGHPEKIAINWFALSDDERAAEFREWVLEESDRYVEWADAVDVDKLNYPRLLDDVDPTPGCPECVDSAVLYGRSRCPACGRMPGTRPHGEPAVHAADTHALGWRDPDEGPEFDEVLGTIYKEERQKPKYLIRPGPRLDPAARAERRRRKRELAAVASHLDVGGTRVEIARAKRKTAQIIGERRRLQRKRVAMSVAREASTADELRITVMVELR